MNMKKFLLSILCCLLAVVSGYAEEYSYTFTAKQFTANGTKTLNGVDWNLSGDGGYWGHDGTKGQQFGSNNAPYKSLNFSTDDIPGTIESIVINTSGASSTNAKLVVTVGGVQYGAQKSLTASATNHTFEGASSGEINLSYTQTSKKAIYIKSITVTYKNNSSEPSVLSSPKFTPAGCEFSDYQEVTITAENGAVIYYTLDSSVPTKEFKEYDGVITLTETTTVKAFAVKEGYKDSEVVEATYTKRVLQEGQVEDVLTREWTGIKNGATGYSSWSDLTSTSSAKYSGNSAGSNDAIQLRSKNSNSGIVTTVSGGKVKKIIVEWQSSTANGRTLTVYGKNGAYTSPEDLYGGEAGTTLGTIVKGSSTELEIKGQFTHIGLRSKSDAMYITSITIIWEVPYTLQVKEAGWATMYLDKNVTIPENVNCYIISEVTEGAATLKKITGVLPAKTGVIIEAKEGKYDFVGSTEEGSAVDGNKLLGTTVNTNISEEAYVLGLDEDGVVGLYKAKMNGGVFLNNANKAYLPASAVSATAQGANGFKFRFETTGIEGVSAVKGEKVIFDLAGRKLNDMSAPGIYIVNGKKVMVK